MESSEVEKNVKKIKELLKSEIFDQENLGLELARSLDEPTIYDKLLEGCRVNDKGYLINENEEINDILIVLLVFSADTSKGNLISKELSHLFLNHSRYLSLFAVDDLCNIKHLSVSCDELISLDIFTSLKLPNLSELNLNNCNSIANLNGLANCKLPNLTILNLGDCDSLKNLDGLINTKFTNLTDLDLSYCESLENIDGLANLTSLTSLNLSNNYCLVNIEPIGNLINLTFLDLEKEDLQDPVKIDSWRKHEVKKKIPCFKDRTSTLVISFSLYDIIKEFMDKDVKSIISLISFLESSFDDLKVSMDDLDSFGVIQKSKYFNNIDTCKIKILKSIKDEYAYVNKKDGFDFNDSDQLYTLLAENREFLEGLDDIEDCGETLEFKNIEIKAEISTINEVLLKTTDWYNFISISAVSEKSDTEKKWQHNNGDFWERTYINGAIEPCESNF